VASFARACRRASLAAADADAALPAPIFDIRALVVSIPTHIQSEASREPVDKIALRTKFSACAARACVGAQSPAESAATLAAMQITDLLERAKQEGGFNDIWFYAEDDERQPLEDGPVRGLLGGSVEGLQAFGRRGCGSLFALWRGNVVWLGSEGDQCVIAKDVDDFVDALLLDTGAIWQIANNCQESDREAEVYRNGRHLTAEELRERFTSAWMQENVDYVRKQNGERADRFAEWASSMGRRVPNDLVERMVALRPLTVELRAVCSAAAPAEDPDEEPAPARSRRKKKAKPKTKTKAKAKPKAKAKANATGAAKPKGKAKAKTKKSRR
jgi:hypothetical protein